MTQTIRWGAFALTTSCPETLQRAAQVFGPWISTRPTEQICHWTINRLTSGWEIRNDQNDQVDIVDTPEDVVIRLEYGAVLALEFPGTHLKMHGALLLTPSQQQGLVLLGHGGAGKSTLCTALFAGGWTLLCDDTVFIDFQGQRARPSPRRVALREESRPLLGESLWQRVLSAPSSYLSSRGPLFHPHELTHSQPDREVALGAIVILKAEPPSATLRPIDSVAAVFELAAYSGLFRSHGLAGALAPLSQLAGRVPVYELTRGPLLAMQESLASLGTAGL